MEQVNAEVNTTETTAEALARMNALKAEAKAKKAAEKAEAKAAADAKKVEEKAAKAAAKAAADAVKAEAKAKKDADKAANAGAIAAKKAEREAKKAEKEAKKAERLANKQPEQNGMTRPRAGSKTGRVWEICDAMCEAKGTAPSAKEVIDAAVAEGANQFMARSQYAYWRKFNGITGRIAKPEQAAETQATEAQAVA